ncbi:MAG: GNAT family N-acetyltransferase [Gammaproteobacteria bacterium]|nr:GNAT family N-acetyltransferase [Gammaproteobacteria bacterium]
MPDIRVITRPEELQHTDDANSLGLFDPYLLSRHRVDEHLLLMDDEGMPLGRCSLWWREVPEHDAYQLGAIGHYASVDDSSAETLLQYACKRLQEQGCQLAVGPMDGNTWRSYRFVTDAGSEPAFFLEPENPKEYPDQWLASGFEPLATYTSAINPDLSEKDARIEKALKRFNDRGVRIRSLRLDDFDKELETIYAISVMSFRDNYLYTPIDKNEFIEQYQKVKPYVQPELTFIAEIDGRAVAFLFAIPDLAQAQRGERPDTVIIKTVAVLPERASRGLGSLLVGYAQYVAHEAGFKRAIHALMHETNISGNISAHYATTMRRYTLFGKQLG